MSDALASVSVGVDETAELVAAVRELVEAVRVEVAPVSELAA